MNKWIYLEIIEVIVSAKYVKIATQKQGNLMSHFWEVETPYLSMYRQLRK